MAIGAALGTLDGVALGEGEEDGPLDGMILDGALGVSKGAHPGQLDGTALG